MVLNLSLQGLEEVFVATHAEKEDFRCDFSGLHRSRKKSCGWKKRGLKALSLWHAHIIFNIPVLLIVSFIYVKMTKDGKGKSLKMKQKTFWIYLNKIFQIEQKEMLIGLGLI